MRNMKQSNTFNRLGAGILAIVILFCCFFGTTFTLRPAYAEMQQAPAASLNGGDAVINFASIEPGMTIQKTFYIKNTGTETVNYGFYFRDNIDPSKNTPLSGALAEVLEVTIFKKVEGQDDWVLTTGKMSELTKINTARVNQYENPAKMAELKSEEKIETLILQIHYPETAGREGMGKTLDFDFCLAFSAVSS